MENASTKKSILLFLVNLPTNSKTFFPSTPSRSFILCFSDRYFSKQDLCWRISMVLFKTNILSGEIPCSDKNDFTPLEYAKKPSAILCHHES
jgi:hypothetical protein